MAVTYVKSSTGAADISGAWTQNLALTSPGNVIIGQVMADGDTTGTTQTLGTCTNIENLAGTDSTMTALANATCGTNGWQYLWIGRSLSATVTFAGTTAGNDIWFIIHEFTGVHTGTALTDVVENSTAGTVVNGSGTTSPVLDTGVTTLGADRLALNCIGINDDVTGLASFAGESGGDWTLAVQFGDATGTDGLVALQTAAMASAGTIDGGSDAVSAAASWGVLGFALIPPGGAAATSLIYQPARSSNYSR